jgi:hypothetical protein
MRQKRDQSELGRIFASCSGAFAGVGVFSAGVNI